MTNNEHLDEVEEYQLICGSNQIHMTLGITQESTAGESRER
jgi:hypothetical protein